MDGAEQAPRGAGERRWAIALALVSGVGLFWWLQPLSAEALVIRYGGGAEVWTACLCFFQLTLLGGYLYAHLLSRALEPRRALNVHGALVVLCVALMQWPRVDVSDLDLPSLTWRVMAQLAGDWGPAAGAVSQPTGRPGADRGLRRRFPGGHCGDRAG